MRPDCLLFGDGCTVPPSPGLLYPGSRPFPGGLLCEVLGPPAHQAGGVQGDDKHGGAPGVADEDHVSGQHQEEPGPADLPKVLLHGSGMVGRVSLHLAQACKDGGLQGHRLHHPHDQQRLPGPHSPSRGPRALLEVAQRGPRPQRGLPRQGAAADLALLPGLHAGLCLSAADPTGSAAIPGELDVRKHG